MVEGPGVKIKCETMRKKTLNQRITSVRCGEGRPIAKIECMVGLKLIDVVALGKELFVIFEQDVCLRLHFLMNGSVRYDFKKFQEIELPRGSARGNSTLTLSMELEKVKVNVFDSSYQIRQVSECLQKYQRMKDLDVCSPSFSISIALQTIRDRKHSDRMVCDVIMDQEVAPGLGNIIKNEALFDSGIKPITLVKELDESLLRRMIDAYIEFSKIFYQTRKTCRPLQPHMRVYNKQSCTVCSSVLVKCKPGEYKRPTWFCNQCQQNKPGMVPPRSVPIESRKRKVTPEQGPSSKCTKITDFFCSPKSSGQLTGLSNAVSLGSGLAEFRAFPVHCSPRNVPGSLGHQSPSRGSSCNGFGASADASWDTEEDVRPKERVITSFSPKTGFLRTSETSPATASLRSSQISTQSGVREGGEVLSGPSCSQHKLPCKENYVVKDGPNKNRLFYSCKLPRVQQCNYFMWADDRFPKCKHDAISTRRKVLKLNENNGRAFYCCRMERVSQCDFFQWCDQA